MTPRQLRLTVAALAILALLLSHAAESQAVQGTDPQSALQSDGWQTVAGPDRTFTADMPAAPSYSSNEMRTVAGSNYTMHQYLLEQGDVAYVAQTAIYPADVSVSNHRTNLQGGLDNAAKNMEGGKWASVGWVTYQGLTGVDAIGERSNHAIRSFSVMKGRQIVTLTYAGPPGSARSAEADKFMASLRVGQ